MKSKIFSVVAILLGLSVAQSASAYITDIAGASRTFTVDSTNFFSGVDDNADSLVSYGNGNITANARRGHIPEGWTVLVNQKGKGIADDAISLTRESKQVKYSGSFSILDSNIWNEYSRIAIGLNVANKRKSPDWVIVELEQFAKEGVWSVAPTRGGKLSSYLVYGIPNTIAAAPVPVPGAFWLLGSGLVGLGAMARNKRTSAK